MKNWDGYSNLVLGKVLFWRPLLKISFGFVEISWIFFWTSGSQVNCLGRGHDSSMLGSNQAPSPGFWKTISTSSSLSMVALPWPAAMFEFLSLASHQWTHSAISSCSSFFKFLFIETVRMVSKNCPSLLAPLGPLFIQSLQMDAQQWRICFEKKRSNLHKSFFQRITLQ